MLVSVIIPVYNVEQYLDRCIESVVQQTYRDLEIILVDDGSPDNCPQICDAWAQKDARIVVIHKKNGGVSEARNFGIECATGDCLSFVDSDDFIAPNMIERLHTTMLQDETDLVACNFVHVYENSNMPDKQIAHITENEVVTGVQALENLHRRIQSPAYPAWNKLYKSDLFQGVRFPVGKLHEDVIVTHEILYQCNKVSLVTDSLYYYLQRSGSTMHTMSFLRWMNWLDARFSCFDFIHEKKSESKVISIALFRDILKFYAGYSSYDVKKEDYVILMRYKNRIESLYQEICANLSLEDKLNYFIFCCSPKLFRFELRLMSGVKRRLKR